MTTRNVQEVEVQVQWYGKEGEGGGRWALNGSGFDLEVRGAAAALVGESCASCSALCSAQPTCPCVCFSCSAPYVRCITCLVRCSMYVPCTWPTWPTCPKSPTTSSTSTSSSTTSTTRSTTSTPRGTTWTQQNAHPDQVLGETEKWIIKSTTMYLLLSE